jgi:hypothetical protein
VGLVVEKLAAIVDANRELENYHRARRGIGQTPTASGWTPPGGS